MRATSLCLVVVCAGLGCSSGDAGEPSPRADDDAWQGVEGNAPTPADGALRARSASGVRIALRPGAPEPLGAGPVRFLIDVEADIAGPLPVSVDVVSPTMPMHGVRRYAAEHLEGHRYAVDAELPMEGTWAVYVNLDAGGDAAAFELEVAPSSTGEGHQHGGATPSDTADHHHDHRPNSSGATPAR